MKKKIFQKEHSMHSIRYSFIIGDGHEHVELSCFFDILHFI